MNLSPRRLLRELRQGLMNATRDTWLFESLAGGVGTSSGKHVNAWNAMSVPGVWACVRVPSEDMSKLPLYLFQRTGRGRAQMNTHPLYDILLNRPNPEMSARDFKLVMELHVELRGNAFAQIVRGPDGHVLALWPLHPDGITITRHPVTGELVYLYRPLNGGQETPLLASEVFHLRGLSADGIVGLSPVKIHRETIGGDMAVREYGTSLFGNGANPGGFLKHPGELSEAAQNRLVKAFEGRHGGSRNAGRIGVLEEGMDFIRVGLSAEDAQYLQTKKYGITDLARIWRVPAHKVNDLERATFSNIEQLAIEWVQDGIVPRAEMWEGEIRRSLLTELERKTLFAKFDVSALLRGDINARVAYYSAGRNGGWLSGNDIRDAEGLNPVESDAMDAYFIPLNMQPIEHALDAPEPTSTEAPTAPGSDQGGDNGAARSIERRAVASATVRRRVADSYRGVIADAAKRTLKREKSDVMRAAEKILGRRDAGLFMSFLEDFYRDHREFITANMAPVIASLGEAIGGEAAAEVGYDGPRDLAGFLAEYVATYAARHAGLSLSELRETVEQAGPDPEAIIAALDARFTTWLDTRPDSVANEEAVRASDAVAVTVYGLAGVRYLRWVTFGANCAYCNHLAGQRIALAGYFLNKGDSIQPEGASTPLTTSSNIRHAPAHRGCDCTIAAA